MAWKKISLSLELSSAYMVSYINLSLPKLMFLFRADTNGDQMLDALELEAMFLVEVRKIYGQNSDPTELYEEMSRMREHVMKEIDRNGDGLLSINEFLG